MFEGLKGVRADAFPSPGTLTRELEKLLDSTPTLDVMRANRVLSTTFATAAIEMWLRSLHSFLISASLTEASPIWASVSGYYSSHYAIRGFAHLFGAFKMHKKGKIVCLNKEAGNYCFRFINSRDREHRFYWKYVSEHPQLAGDPFFYSNPDNNSPESDVAHRDKANYWDHINRFPVFKPLDEKALQQRVERIANIEFSDVTRPNRDRFPDINNIQIVAYHRIVKFRNLMDEILKSGNSFWKVHRSPPWRPTALRFAVADLVTTALYKVQ